MMLSMIRPKLILDYVVQSVIVCGTESDRNRVIEKLKGSVQLSKSDLPHTLAIKLSPLIP
jgi:tRNA 2-selenouridine synthase SelU